MLTKSNYHEWSLLMKVKLEARHLWDAIHVGGVRYEDDRRAMEALCASVPLDVAASIANKRTTKLAWDAIALRRIGGDRGACDAVAPTGRVGRSCLSARRASRGLRHASQQCDGADGVEQRHRPQRRAAVEKLLRCMPKKYMQIVNSIETLLDFDAPTIEDVIGRFKSVQDREQADDFDSINASDKLLYTAEQWRAFST